VPNSADSVAAVEEGMPDVEEVAATAQPALAASAEQEPTPPIVPAPQSAVPPQNVAPTEATLGAAAQTMMPPLEPETVSEPANAQAATDPIAGSSGYDHLFGATVMRSVEDAAVRVEEEADEIADHTVMVEDIAALRAQRRAERGRDQSAPPAPRFSVELPSGEVEVLDQSIIVGRAPSASRVSGSAVPRLVTIMTPNQDISRSHVQIAVEGDTVVVTDLHSMNGTLVTVPGRNPQRLREGEPTAVLAGTLLDLGDGAKLMVREV
jgi:hypothetical protein